MKEACLKGCGIGCLYVVSDVSLSAGRGRKATEVACVVWDPGIERMWNGMRLHRTAPVRPACAVVYAVISNPRRTRRGRPELRYGKRSTGHAHGKKIGAKSKTPNAERRVIGDRVASRSRRETSNDVDVPYTTKATRHKRNNATNEPNARADPAPRTTRATTPL